MAPVNKELLENLEEHNDKPNFDKIKSSFGISYSKYKLDEELDKQYFDVEYFNYKLEMILYTIVIAASLSFILYSIYSFVSNMHLFSGGDLFLISVPIFIFGYIALFVSYLMKRKKRKFQTFLFKRFEKFKRQI
jgi:hypothetical protein